MLAVGLILIFAAVLIANFNAATSDEGNVWDAVAGILLISGGGSVVASVAIWAWRVMP